MKLIDFSIEKWKAGGKVVHRNGKEPKKVLGWFEELEFDNKLIVIDYWGRLRSFYENGGYYQKYEGDHSLDLMIQERNVLVHIYDNLRNGKRTSSLHELPSKDFKFIKSIEIELD